MTKRPPKKRKARPAADAMREQAKAAPHGDRPAEEARQENIDWNTTNQGYQQDR